MARSSAQPVAPEREIEGQEVRTRTVVFAMGLLLGVLAGCGAGRPTIPPGAQVVHVVATTSEVRVGAASVHAGNVYLELDDPAEGGSFTLVQQKTTAAATPGPLTNDDLARLAVGDTEGMSISAAGPSCIGAQGNGRGQLAAPGICGNVFMFVLGPGKYAILGPSWTEQQTQASTAATASSSGPVIPTTMAVLDVLP